MKKLLLFLLTLLYSYTLILSPSLAQTSSCLGDDPNPGIDFKDTGCSVFGSNTLLCKQVACMFDQKDQNKGPWYAQSPTQFAEKVLKSPESEVFGERYTFAQINWILNSIFTMLNPSGDVTSFDGLIQLIQNFQKVLAKVQTDPQNLSFADYAQLGPAGLFAGGISTIYQNPPASAVGEIRYTASRLLDPLTPSVYAQGVGFSGLNSGGAVRALWTASRNAAYFITAILLIASGLMVMFRVKLNPQTVITVQQMIPKLVMTLLLITFSFAIAGLVIDLIYVVLIGIMGLLSPTVGNIATGISRGFALYIGGQFFVFFVPLLIIGLALGITGGILGLLIGIPGGAGGIALGGVVGLLLGLLVVLVIFIHFLITLFNIFKMMLMTYVTLVLQISFAPIQIMFDLVPGQQGFGPWLRNIIASSSVFVVVPLMLSLELFFLPELLQLRGTSLRGWSDLGGSNLELPFFSSGALTSGLASYMWRFFIAYGIFSLTPKVADMVKDALKVPPFKYGQAIDEGLGAIQKGFNAPYNYLLGSGSSYFEGVSRDSGRRPGERAIASGLKDLADRLRGK